MHCRGQTRHRTLEPFGVLVVQQPVQELGSVEHGVGVGDRGVEVGIGVVCVVRFSHFFRFVLGLGLVRHLLLHRLHRLDVLDRLVRRKLLKPGHLVQHLILQQQRRADSIADGLETLENESLSATLGHIIELHQIHWQHLVDPGLL